MKNFFKKLSFVLASAMVITSLYAPANTSAAAKDGIILKGKAVTKKGIFVGGEKVNFDYKIGKHNNKGANGKWSVSDTSVITVDKHGKVTAVGTGDATLYLKVKKNAKKGIKKNLTFKVKINAMARADKLTIPASDKAITLKVGEVKDIMPVLTDKVEGVKNTYTLFARTDNPTDVAVEVKDNAKVVVTANNPTATSATITVFAAQKSNEDDAFNNKYKVEDTFTVDVKPNLEVKQTAANKLTVTGKALVASDSAYVIKNEKDVVLAIENKVVVSEDMTEAVLTAISKQIPVGKYTLSYDKGEPVSFEVVKSDAAEIVFSPEDKAVLSPDKKTAKIFYTVRDQFGVDVTKEYASANRTVTTNRTVKTDKAGEIEVQATSDGNGTFNPGFDTIAATVTIISTNLRPISKTAMFKADDEARLAEVEYKGVWDVVNRKIVTSIPADADVNSETDRTLTNYKLLFKAKDQFGNPFYGKTGVGAAAVHAAQQLQVYFGGTTGLMAVTDKDKAKDEEISNEKYLVYPLKASTADVRAGEVEVNGIVVNNGKNVKGNFTVTPAKRIAEIKVFELPQGVYAGQENELGFTLLDAEGNPVTEWKKIDALNDAKFLKDFVSPKATSPIKFRRDIKTGKVTLWFTPTVEPVNQSIMQVLTFLSPDNKFSMANIRVQARRYPVAISRIKPEAYRGVTRAHNAKHELLIKAEDILFQDQYGNNMTAGEVMNYNDVATGTTFGDQYKRAKLRVWFGDLQTDGTNANQFAHPVATSDTLDKADFTDVNTGNTTVTPASATAFENDEGTKISATTDEIVKVYPRYDVKPGDKVTKSAKVNVALWTVNRQNKDELKPVSTISFNIYNALIDNLYGLGVEDVDLLPARDLDYETHSKLKEAPVYRDNVYTGIKAFGNYDGAKIKMVAEDDFDVFTPLSDKKTVVIPTMDSIPSGNTEATFAQDVYVHKTVVEKITKQLKYSKAARYIDVVEVPDNREIKLGLAATDSAPTGWGDANNELKDKLTLKDQYKLVVDKDVDPSTVTVDSADNANKLRTLRLSKLKPIIEVLDYDKQELFVKNNGSVDTKFGFVGAATSSEATVRFTFPTAKKSFEFVLKFLKQN